MDSISQQMKIPTTVLSPSQPQISNKPAATRDKVEELIDALGKMTLELKVNMDAMKATSSTQLTANSNSSSGKENTFKPKYCIYCESEEHYRSSCQELNTDIDQNRASINKYGKIWDSQGNQLSLSKGHGGIMAFIRGKSSTINKYKSSNYVKVDSIPTVPARERFIGTLTEPSGEVHEYLMEPEEAKEVNSFIEKRKANSQDWKPNKNFKPETKTEVEVIVPLSNDTPPDTKRKGKYQMYVADSATAQ
ncbi:hypothetical protein K7432_015852 [Basidiobolus ranarum]|uniref:Reverse transcriptase domain-containing protein n=1 Tax=Basidiobolus ranarum TaxID=34480 RepID=A0ABR2VMG4_9FUNG